MNPRSYRGRNRSNRSGFDDSRQRREPRQPTGERLNFSEMLKKYFKKLLKQTAVVSALVLILYITSAVAPNFWANISAPINNTLAHNIDFAEIYNNTLGRFFQPDEVDEVDEDSDDLYESDYQPDYEYYDNGSDYSDYNGYGDDEPFEAFQILDPDETVNLYVNGVG